MLASRNFASWTSYDRMSPCANWSSWDCAVQPRCDVARWIFENPVSFLLGSETGEVWSLSTLSCRMKKQFIYHHFIRPLFVSFQQSLCIHVIRNSLSQMQAPRVIPDTSKPFLVIKLA